MSITFRTASKQALSEILISLSAAHIGLLIAQIQTNPELILDPYDVVSNVLLVLMLFHLSVKIRLDIQSHNL